MSIFQKGGKGLEGSEYRLANGIRDKEEESKVDEEEMEEQLGKAKGCQPSSVANIDETEKIKEGPMQFPDRDEEEEEI
ncbi:probable atp-dependent rna helicase [Lynx pardinus]|uniref:Probable atp-dependent rna helicase n=1 Tax=Lynx pardinus TaxID=191816 RepID=A0A485NYT4_LYNPA|nr:probable atp-dependent rna helicase [Lynx pardinus]